MTVVKLQGKPAAAASAPLEVWADKLYNNPGLRLVALVEFKHAGRYEPEKEEGKDRTVDIKLSALEVATPAQEDDLRKAMRAMYLARTAETGEGPTLDTVGELELSKGTLELLGERIADAEMVRLMVGVKQIRDYTRKVFTTRSATEAELRYELEAIYDALLKLSSPGVELAGDRAKNILKDGSGLFLSGEDQEDGDDGE